MKTYHRWHDTHNNKIHACVFNGYDRRGFGQNDVFTECGCYIFPNLSRHLEEATVTCQYCLALWTPWRGGEPPVADDEPVQMWWANGIQRVYERGDWIVWLNLPTDGTVRWRKPL